MEPTHITKAKMRYICIMYTKYTLVEYTKYKLYKDILKDLE